MKLYLAGCMSFKDVYHHSKYILESFVDMKGRSKKLDINPDNFLLDSGAFTFMNNTKKYANANIDWFGYIDEYAEFINQNNISNFFELDIDVIVGYENVLKLRRRLERKTNRNCIPVWHRTRGKEEFIKMCDEYSYVALGGLANKEIKLSEHDVLNNIIDIAHKHKAKIHGLGLTSIPKIKMYHFDSVDSTSWVKHPIYGGLSLYQDYCREKKIKVGRTANHGDLCRLSFLEWCKFQKYAEWFL